ncbi:hypothetical protein G3I59_13225 [Amycolatopsis rubida]|uniref:Uncharacterized protein n=1 Tax=Amycolatopsis rubida TaxID=112413 RepID=A0ABX0BM49_9PSEU|nr:MULTISPECIES: hypothetical protein [Amycolatopsis]MYW91535.1 hypothetical protein [Amycolatopsis rubida]NEC56520.1 hypothetical protein [Amycolatopsis rubida]
MLRPLERVCHNVDGRVCVEAQRGDGGFGRECFFEQREAGRGAGGQSVQSFPPLQQAEYPDQAGGLVGDVDVAEVAAVLVQQGAQRGGLLLQRIS